MSLVLVSVKRSEGFLFTIQIDIKITVKLLPFLNITKIKVLENFELAKKVIKGECLINVEFI